MMHVGCKLRLSYKYMCSKQVYVAKPLCGSPFVTIPGLVLLLPRTYR